MIPLPSLGFFFIPRSGDPSEIVDCWLLGLRPAAHKTCKEKQKVLIVCRIKAFYSLILLKEAVHAFFFFKCYFLASSMDKLTFLDYNYCTSNLMHRSSAYVIGRFNLISNELLADEVRTTHTK